MEGRSSSCSFSDALYITAEEEGTKTMATSSGTISSYYSAPTHLDNNFQEESSGDSGLSSSSPGYFLESQVDIDLLEETLEDADNIRVTPDEEERESSKITSSSQVGHQGNYIEDEREEDVKSVPDLFVMVPQRHPSSTNISCGSWNESEPLRKTSRVSKTSDTTSTYTFDGEYIESDMFEQPSMEYDLSWQPRAESSPMKKEAREKIFIRELSFDENQDVKGIDLMAPVFLAVTNEDDDNVFDMKRKAISIEDLCSKITYPRNEDIFPRPRSKSTNSINPKRKVKKPSPLSMDDKRLDADESLEDAKERLSSLSASLKSQLSYEDLHSASSNTLHTSIEFEIPNNIDDHAFLETVSNAAADYINEDNKENGTREFDFNLKTIESDRKPHRVEGENCGFWEYPYGSPSSPSSPVPTQTMEMVKSPSLNTSPTSPAGNNTNASDRFVVVGVAGQQRIVDMKLIEPYLKILTHGGHHMVDNVCHVIVVFNAFYLPPRNTSKYNIVLEQLFYYCAHALDLLVSDSYEIVFFNSGMDGNNMPPRDVIKQCYDIVQYRLKKNLKNIYFVHPSLLLKTVLRFTRFFISTKFRRKMRFVKNLKTLKSFLPLEYIFISPELHQMEKKFT